MNELESLLHTLVAESMDEAGKYIESKGRLIQRPIQARIAPVLAQVEADRKKHELQARIHELQGVISWNVDAKTNLKVVSTITATERIAELKQELESYEYRHQSS